MGIWTNGQWMYEGMVVGYRERNGYDDSYYFAQVWNPATKEVFEVSVGGTWCAGGTAYTVDAGPEVREEMERAYAERRAAEEAKTVRYGKRVRVVRGRKVPKGTEGKVIWMGESRYGYKVTKRIGLKDEAGTVYWTALTNVEVVAA